VVFFSSVLHVDETSLNRHVNKALKTMMKGLQANGDVDEEDLDDMVSVSLRKAGLTDLFCSS
jgi:hypothetical protein